MRELAELPALRKRSDGFLWLDIPEWSDAAESILANEFHFHPMAIAESKDSQPRSPGPRVSRPLSSSSCTRQRLVRAAMCTISNWTNSLLRALLGHRPWALSARRCRWRQPCARPALVGDTDGKRHGCALTSPFALTYAIVSTIARLEAEMVAEIAA